MRALRTVLAQSFFTVFFRSRDVCGGAAVLGKAHTNHGTAVGVVGGVMGGGRVIGQLQRIGEVEVGMLVGVGRIPGTPSCWGRDAR